jgi:BlaI family transcriptional regulator, penicillinase repressor
LTTVIYHGKSTCVTEWDFNGTLEMKTTRFGRMQLKIMQVLWEHKDASARQITDLLGRRNPVAHSTVQTLLRKLEDKGAVSHIVKDRTFLYHPLVQRRIVTRNATRDLIERIFGGSTAGLVAHLLKEERIPPEELSQIRELIDQQATGQGK